MKDDNLFSFAEYQKAAIETAIYPIASSVIYPAFGLVGEAGEVANKVKKIYREDDGQVTPQRREQIAEELGDVLWYVAALSADLGLEMSEIARKNIAKLQSRQQRGVLQGDGDKR